MWIRRHQSTPRTWFSLELMQPARSSWRWIGRRPQFRDQPQNLAQAAQQLHGVHARHLDVEDGEVRGLSAKPSSALAPSL